jgi:nucleoside-diphosphate-sugar epimerase
MPKVLLTGGTGFIGVKCCQVLLDAGWSVHVLDSRPPKSDSTFYGDDKFSFQQGNICSAMDVEKAIEGCDAVVHLAAQISVPESFEHPEANYHTNVVGTQIILDAALSHGITSLVTASSAAVYGDADQLPLSEVHVGSCLSPYAESKWENEHQIQQSRKDGLNAIALRFFNVYGPGQSATGGYASVIPKFIDMMSIGEAPTVHGDGSQTRDFVHVRDVSVAILKLLELQEPFSHSVANVCSQTELSVIELIEIINRCFVQNGSIEEPLESIYTDSRQGDIHRSCGNNSRLQSMIKWDTVVDFEDGISELVNQVI